MHLFFPSLSTPSFHNRFFFGKNKVMAIALGKTPEDEIKPGLHRVAAVTDMIRLNVSPLTLTVLEDHWLLWSDVHK